MKRLALCIAIAAISTSAFAVTAVFTGQQRFGTSVTGLAIVSCQYQFAGQYFWRTFQGSCPATVEVN